MMRTAFFRDEKVMAKSDRRRMIEFIGSQLPDGEATLLMASGGGDEITASVRLCGDDLEIESNLPEWVSVREVYEHLRWIVMPSWEQEQWLGIRSGSRRVSPQSRLELLADRLDGAVTHLEVTLSSKGDPALRGESVSTNYGPSEFLRIKEVAAILACSYSEARDRLLDGRIQAIRDGRCLRTRREWVEDYINKRLVKPPINAPEIPTIRVRKPRRGQVVFKKGGMGYQFLKKREENQKKRSS
jgi:excisionase family DNA binding protein